MAFLRRLVNLAPHLKYLAPPRRQLKKIFITPQKRVLLTSTCFGGRFGYLCDDYSFSILGAGKCGFHTSCPRKAIPPLVVVTLRYVAKIGVMLFGRKFRKWWKALPPERKARYLAAMQEKKFHIGAGVCVIFGLCYLYYMSHLQETPITKRKRFLAFTPEQMKEISKYQFELTLVDHAAKILPQADPSYDLVLRVCKKLLNSNKDLPEMSKSWTITVIDEPLEKNAFVLPNGNIFVFTGMLNMCQNEDQLGCILGHEIAHAILGHGVEQVSFLHLVDLVLIVVTGALWAFLPSDILAFFMQTFLSWLTTLTVNLPFGRSLEIEADEVGLELAAKACFDVREASAFWGYMALQLELNKEEEIEWLSTHPNNESRRCHLDDLIPNAIFLRTTCECPTLRSEDPRSGVEKVRQVLTKNREEAAALYSQIKTIRPPRPVIP